MDSCEEDVTIARGLYLLSKEEGKRGKGKQVRTQSFPLGGGGMTVSLYITYV
jgi:hypothetical protein